MKTVTAAQLAALRNANVDGVVRCTAGTGKALEARSLVTRRDAGVGFYYVITDAGRAAAKPAAKPYKPEVARLLALLAAKAV